MAYPPQLASYSYLAVESKAWACGKEVIRRRPYEGEIVERKINRERVGGREGIPEIVGE